MPAAQTASPPRTGRARGSRAPSSGSRTGVVVGAGGEAEQPLVAVLAQVRDRVVADERVAKRAARERVARPAQPIRRT